MSERGIVDRVLCRVGTACMMTGLYLGCSVAIVFARIAKELEERTVDAGSKHGREAMMRDEPNPPPNDGREIVVAVVTAAFTSIATGLATWWVEELRAKYGRTQRQSEEQEVNNGT